MDSKRLIFKKKSPLKLMAVIFGILIFISLVYAGRQYYLEHNPYANINYKTFRLNTLPEQYASSEGSLELWTQRGKQIPYQTIVRFDLHKDATLAQFKSKGDLDCNLRITNQTCDLKRTPNNQPYKVTETTFGSGKEEKTYSLIKDGTQINIDLRGEEVNITDAIWEKTFDSFEEYAYKDLEVKHFEPGP